MKKNPTFESLERVLAGLGFVKTVIAGSHIAFDHAPSGTTLVVRPYRARETVGPGDLISMRKHLVENGLIEPDTFESLLREAVLAG